MTRRISFQRIAEVPPETRFAARLPANKTTALVGIEVAGPACANGTSKPKGTIKR